MKVTEIASIIKGLLNEDYRISINPDLLYLVLPPDILVGGEGNLTAIFVPTKNELKRPSDLLARLAACRLALPTHLQCVLFMDDNSVSESATRRFEREFHYLQRGNDYSKLRRVLVGDFENQRIRKVALTTRNRNFERAEFLYWENQRCPIEEREIEGTIGKETRQQGRRRVHTSIFENEGRFNNPTIKNWLWNEKPVKLRNAIEYEEMIVSEINVTKGFATNRLTRYWIFGIQSDYDLDDGVPYPNPFALNNIKVLVFDQPLPLTFTRADKLFRDAAFTGWFLVEAKTLQQFRTITSEIKESWSSFLREQ